MQKSNEVQGGGGGKSVRAARAARHLGIATLLLLSAFLGLHWIAATDTDLPPLPQFLHEAKEIYIPASRGAISLDWGSVWKLGNAAELAWKMKWLEVNGQWDARLLSTASLAMQVVALGLLFFTLARRLGNKPLVALGLGTLAAVVLSPLAPRPVESAAWPSWLVAGSLLQIALVTRNRAGRPRWMLGWGIGVLNIVAGTAGIASSLALFLWGLLGAFRDSSERRTHLAVMVPGGVLVGFGIVLAGMRTGSEAGTFLHSLTLLAAWPFDLSPWALLMWAPAVFALGTWLRRPASHPALGLLALLSLWGIAQIVVLATLHAPNTDFVREVLLAGVLVNAACLTVLPVGGALGPTRNLAIVVAWCSLVASALIQPAPERITTMAGPENEGAVASSLREAAFYGKRSMPSDSSDLSEETWGQVVHALGDNGLRSILPGSIRPPLSEHPAEGSAGAGFHASGAPDLPGLDSLPFVGTWSQGAPSMTSEFISRTFESKASLIQIRIAGTYAPPFNSVVLRTADGQDVAPMDRAFTADSRWKRINFETPSGPFQIVAHAEHGKWLAFTAPEEMGWYSWAAGKLIRSWGVWLGAALLALALGVTCAVSAWPKAPPAPTTGPRLMGRAVPWMVLFAYAVFLSRDLDTTAGPNDSGGYLNSAKVMLGGHLTAAPKMIFGAAAGETDLAPYLPGTFSETHDGRMAPDYPVGFPLEVWAVAKLTSLAVAVPTVILLQLILGVVFTRRLARAVGLPEGWAWVAAGIIALSPVYLFQALQPLSDGPALVWASAAVGWAWTSRENPRHAIWAGIATAMAVLIRPSNILCVLPILICLAPSWRRLWMWAFAGLPFGLWLMRYNQQLYGSWLLTGYGDVSTSFALHFVPLTLKSYVRWLPLLFTPLVVLSVAGPFMTSVPLRVRWVLTSWVAAFVVFYALYWCTYDNWYNMRFVMPAAPAMLILALFVLKGMTDRLDLALFSPGSLWRSAVPSVTLGVVLAGLLVADGYHRRVLYWMHANHEHAVGAEWARDHLPADAVVLARHASGPLTYYTNLLVVRTDTKEAQSLPFLERVAGTGRPIYALTYHWERRGYQWGNGKGDGYPDVPGRWERLAVLWEGEIVAWRWHPPGPEAQ